MCNVQQDIVIHQPRCDVWGKASGSIPCPYMLVVRSDESAADHPGGHIHGRADGLLRNVYSIQKSNLYYQKILEKYKKRQIIHIDTSQKCSDCSNQINFRRTTKVNNKFKCFCCKWNWRHYTLINTFYNKSSLYMNDCTRDLAFHLDILETYTNSDRNIFGETIEIINIDSLGIERKNLYKYRNKLRIRTSKMFWAIFSINKIYNDNCLYLPTELIIEIIYQTMYWIPKINY